jgi:hypothetical protein
MKISLLRTACPKSTGAKTRAENARNGCPAVYARGIFAARSSLIFPNG